MARKYRIAAIGTLTVTLLAVAIVGGAYYAAQQVEPYYEEALRTEPEVLERGSRELESRATALYSDAKQIGHWQALFTVEQINGWLAMQLAKDNGSGLPENMRDPRIAISRDAFTLGFRTKSGGVETVISVDASVLITDDGNVGIRFMSVRAGALPLPILQLADELATACKKLKLPVRWTQEHGRPIAIVNIANDTSSGKREFFIDAIELRNNEMYVAGHTEVNNGQERPAPRLASSKHSAAKGVPLDDYELRLTPSDEHSALQIARRPSTTSSEGEDATNH
jgi:hypothetical protein